MLFFDGIGWYQSDVFVGHDSWIKLNSVYSKTLSLSTLSPSICN